MPRSILTALLAVVLAAACTQRAPTSAPTSPIVNIPAPVVTADASAAKASQDDGGSEESGAGGGTASVDGGAPAQFRACSLDADCVAVDRVGCCHNGWKEAVAASQKDAYAASFVCPQPHPICPMFLVRDLRVPECDDATHLCTMVQPEYIACGGSGRNAHRCPGGYDCPAGKCVKK